MKNNFYDEFVAGGFFEKKASENENTRKALDLDPDVLEKIASELESISNINDDTLEQKLASDSCDESKENTADSDKQKKELTEGEDEDKEISNKDTEDDKQEKESAEGDEQEKESTEDDKQEKEDDKQEKESSEDQEGDEQSQARNNANTDNSDPEGDKLSQARNNANTDNSDPEGDKQDAIRKQAYELAEQKLSSQGYGLFDYVINKVADEHVATFIVDNAEKLASLSDSSALQYADEIISSVSEKLG